MAGAMQQGLSVPPASGAGRLWMQEVGQVALHNGAPCARCDGNNKPPQRHLIFNLGNLVTGGLFYFKDICRLNLLQRGSRTPE